ncbi:MAG: hypothetical protein JRH20_15665, partial [Deltaproteobacteria bacterium]|nr:hypothetical protein [Deltaproteobacteria bacterium]
TSSLHAVAGTSATNVWAVGAAGSILHFDGTGWRGVTQFITVHGESTGPPTTPLHAVAMDDQNAIVAGDSEALYRCTALGDITCTELHSCSETCHNWRGVVVHRPPSAQAIYLLAGHHASCVSCVALSEGVMARYTNGKLDPLCNLSAHLDTLWMAHLPGGAIAGRAAGANGAYATLEAESPVCPSTQQINGLSDDVTASWAVNSENIFITTAKGELGLFNGYGEQTASSGGLSSISTMVGVWAPPTVFPAALEAYIVGESSGGESVVYEFTRTDENAPFADSLMHRADAGIVLHAIWGTPDGQLFAVGATEQGAGLVLHFSAP